jgi:quinol monooxygenase YgiN
MVSVFIRHRVSDYAVWRQVFDAYAPQRRAGGEQAYRISHQLGEPNSLCLFFEWDSVENAKRFLASEDLASTMQRAGICDQPEIYVTEEIASGST